MKTAVTIPWEAVVEGCPPSKAKALPLVVSSHYVRRSECCREGELFDQLLNRLSTLGADAMLMVSRSPVSARVEALLPALGIVELTSDGQTGVVLQQATHLWEIEGPVRKYVARYARFDPDEPGFFVPPATRDETSRDCLQFLNPAAWGFERTGKRYRWRDCTTMTKKGPATSKRDPGYVVRPRVVDPLADPSADRGDPFDCLPALRESLATHARQIDEKTPLIVAIPKAYALAVALGRCRLFGVAVPDRDDRTLTPDGFRLAFVHLKHRVRWAVRRLHHSDMYSGALRLQNHALEALEARMDVQAAYLALDEAYAAALYDGSPEAPAMSRRHTQVRRLINLFDGNLQKNLPLLRLAASTYLLDNWRRLLAPSYRDCPPWWLDGCIG
jgi:hypothetical protein